MKRVLLLFVTILFTTASFSTVSILPTTTLNAKNVFLPIGNTGKKISLMELTRISQTDLENLTGRKMNFFEKLSFKTGQRKLKKAIAADGTFTKKKLAKFFAKGGDGDTGFHLGGFALGFFLNLIGVLIAYLINDDYKRNRVKWAWIGFGIVAAINIVVGIIILASVN